MPDCLETALLLLEKGFTPLRIEPREKGPRSTGWQVDVPTEEKLRRAFARPSNIGIRCGDALTDGTYLVAIDIDIEEHELYRAVRMAIGEKVPSKRGKKGETYFVRFNQEIKTHKIRWIRDGKNVAAIDVLGRGSQTVIPPSTHPDTGLPYQWTGGKSLLDVSVQELPVFNETLLDEIRGFCKNPDDPIYALNDMEWAGVGGGGNTHDTCVTAVSSMVARQWRDQDIHDRISRAKREACEVAGMPYNWPEQQKVIQGWIDSARDKKFDEVSKKRSSEIPSDWLDDYCYVVDIDAVINCKKGNILKRPQFDNYHARDASKPWNGLLTHPDLRVVDKLTYSPGQPRICKEQSVKSHAIIDCFNTYFPPDIEPQPGDIEPWYELVKATYDNDPIGYDHFFNWMAHLVQFPGERINHSLFIQGKQGIGKDSIFAAMQGVLGSQNYSHVTLEQIESGFNEWLMGKQLVVFQEIMAAGRRQIYNKLKTVITDEELQVNIKFLPLLRYPNRGNYAFVSNYKYAVSIDASDRRLHVWYSKMNPKPDSFYSTFYKWVSDKRNAGHLLHWLQSRDLSTFNPKAPPPMTEAKAQMIRSSASEVEQFLRNAYESRSWPLQQDLISLTHVVSAMRPVMKVSLGMISDALDNIVGDTDFSVRPRFSDDKRPRLRVIRDHEKWLKASQEEIVSYYRVPLPPMSGQSEGGYGHYDQSHSYDGSPRY